MSRWPKPYWTRFNPFITVVVACVWLVLMGMMFREHYISPAHSRDVDAYQIAAAESDDWFMVRLGGAYAGYGRSRQVKDGSKWVLRDDLNISLNIQGQVKPVRIASKSVVDENFRLISFNLKVASGIVSFEHTGRMNGRDLIIDTPSSKGGGSRKLKLYDAPRISRSLGLPVPLAGLKVGDEIIIPVFDPLDGNKWDAVVKVLEQTDVDISGEKLNAWRVKATFRSVELTMWIDEGGRLLKGRMPLNMTVVRSHKADIAREMNMPLKDLPDMIELTSVPLEGSVPDKELEYLKLEAHMGLDLVIPSDEFRQHVSGTEVTLKRETIPEAAYTLPNIDPKMQSYLTSSRFIRSDNSEVKKVAQKVVGSEKDPVKAALKINEFVYSYLKKVPTPGVPDAYTTLMSRQGDCNEHAVLAVSLARAVGIPARISVGLVHMDEGFAYHAWVNYWAGDSWFSADPLMNKAPVTPLYVTLLHGDIDKHVNVLSYIGKLKLKVLEAG